jgi:Zn-dependent metalloprotease
MMKHILVCILLIASSSIALAQPSVLKLKANVQNLPLQEKAGINVALVNETQAGLLFFPNRGTPLPQNTLLPWLSQRLQLRPQQDSLMFTNETVNTVDGFEVKKMRQYYRGIKIEHGVINSTSKNGLLQSLQLEFYSVPDQFDIRAGISATQGLQKALAYVNAEIYAWQLDSTSSDPDRKIPAGELVIIQDYKKGKGEVCLAWKYNIYAINPLYRSLVYINAQTGEVVLDNRIIKHAKNKLAQKPGATFPSLATTNKLISQGSYSGIVDFDAPINTVSAVADTRYNGNRPILADHFSSTSSWPYRLRARRNNHSIIVLDYQQNSHNTGVIPSYESTAPDFTDNDNNWTAAEYDNADMNNGALDVMDNMIWVSDYWKIKHNRNSWDNNNGAVINYVHVWENGAPYDNAYWNGANMHFGDGNGQSGNSKNPVATSLDDCAHELAHGVTTSTSDLVYRWESGALNEAFSDIWAACITNYAKQSSPDMSSEITYRLFEKSSRPLLNPRGLRDMVNPLLDPFKDPSTYHSTYWKDADYVSCPQPSQNGSTNNDMCGVHTNSGVLNKWFHLITEGEVGINTKGKPYSITGLGFGITEKIAYLMELNLTPNAGYQTAMTVSLQAVATAYGFGSAAYTTVKAAWAAVGVDTVGYFNMANTPVFTTNNFTAIGISTNGIVFAGTNYGGLYRLVNDTWEKIPELPDVRINDIKGDNDQGIWIAQSGRLGQQGGGSSIAGGVNYYSDPLSNASQFFTVGAQQQIPSRNARSIFVDKSRLNNGTNARVWVATLAYFTSGNSTSGMLGQGHYSTVPQFIKVNQGINIASNTVGCLTVGGNKFQIWTFVQANNGINQLLVYNAGTNQLVTTYDSQSEPTIPSGFLARAIYGDALGRIWIGLSTGGLLVYDESRRWHRVNLPSVFPPGMAVNFNAIEGNKHGDIFIGTNMGMVYFDAGGGWANRLEDPAYYRLYGLQHGLKSNMINAIAYDATLFKLWVATDSGIVKWDPPCVGSINCYSTPSTRNGVAKTLKSGNWSDTATWESGKIPDSTTAVFITDSIHVDINARCRLLTIGGNGKVIVNSGVRLRIDAEKMPIFNSQRRRQVRRR